MDRRAKEIARDVVFNPLYHDLLKIRSHAQRFSAFDLNAYYFVCEIKRVGRAMRPRGADSFRKMIEPRMDGHVVIQVFSS